LTDEAEKARNYLMKLPARMARISERMTIPQISYFLNGWSQLGYSYKGSE
jgi:hypothetical protein